MSAWIAYEPYSRTISPSVSPVFLYLLTVPVNWTHATSSIVKYHISVHMSVVSSAGSTSEISYVVSRAASDESYWVVGAIS